ncbi:MAG TPA: hypothetical protein VFX43_04395 [Chitinophagaceae bacterium]|nr:hypothetical protein [Chitinophagaceae bacterium]
MKRLLTILAVELLTFNFSYAQHAKPIIDKADYTFLEDMTRAVMDSSRSDPGQSLPANFGKNSTGGTVIRPGGRNTYPSFWIRDYVMSLESGFVSKAEQKHMLLLAAASQCNQTWITRGGSMVPFGALPDHIRLDNSLPIYFPGTYSYEGQGTKEFGMTPPYDDQFYFIRMVYYYVKSTGDLKMLLKKIKGTPLIDRLEIAFKVPPSSLDNGIVYTNDAFRGVDFGFRDAEAITGDLCYTSILKYRAANDLALLFERLGNKEKAGNYRDIAQKIKKALPGIFLNTDGMLVASTGESGQPDVWATAYAVYLDLLAPKDQIKACQHLADAYKKGLLSYKGNIRHILKGDDFNDQTAWEHSIVPKNRYQNGAYWGTPVGWVAAAIAKVQPRYARQLVREYIDELRADDFRKGSGFGAPFECFYPPDYKRGPVYLTSVSCPYIVFKTLSGN